MTSKPLPRRVLLAMSMASKSTRDRISGVLRYNLSSKWELMQFDPNRCSATAGALADILCAWQPDGILSTAAALPLIHQATADLPPRKRPLHVCLEAPTTTRHRLHALLRIANADVVRAAVETLVRRGIRHFGFASVHTPLTDPHVSARVQGLRREARARECSCAAFIAESDAQTPDVAALAQWLTDLPKPCGILLFNDACAISVYAACRQAGLSIPEQVFLIGVDNDTMICENVDPPLSSILPDFEGAGYRAAERLDALFHGAKLPDGKLMTYGVKTVIERGSTMDVSGASRYVYRAREYLDHNPNGRLTVAQVAAALNMSPRLLEKHFARCTGHTLQQEMLDRRFKRLTELLATTNRPINELIDLCGWTSISSAKRLFHDRYGKSMREFRQITSPT